MTIEIDDKSYIVGIWFSSCPKTDNNWLACVIKDPDNLDRYKGWSRFRYNKGGEPFDNKDEKSWREFYSKKDDSEENLIVNMDECQKAIEAGYPGKDRIIVKGDIKKMMQLSKNKEWMHILMRPSKP